MSDGVSEYWKEKKLAKEQRHQNEMKEEDIIFNAYTSLAKITGNYKDMNNVFTFMDDRFHSRMEPWPG